MDFFEFLITQVVKILISREKKKHQLNQKNAE